MHIKPFYLRPAFIFPAYLFVSFIIYSSGLNGPFVYDDPAYVSENPWIHSLGNFLNIAGARYAGDLSFALNYQLSGKNPFGYHAVNIAIHAFNSALVFILVAMVFETPMFKGLADKAGLPDQIPSHIALASSALFLTHPIQIEAVTYISQRYTSLAAFFYFLSIVLYLRSRSLANEGEKRFSWFYAASIASAVLAMKTKEISFTLPFMLLLFELSFCPGARSDNRKLAKRLLPFFLASLIIPLSLILPEYGLMTSGNKMEELMRARKIAEASAMSRLDYLLSQPAVLMAYLRQVVLPIDITINGPAKISIFKSFLCSIAILSMIASAAYFLINSVRNKKPLGALVSFGIIWFFVAISVESSVIPIKDLYNERRMYLPSAGLFISAAAFCYSIARKNACVKPVRITAVLLVLAVLPFSAKTFLENRYWADALALYERDAALRPYSAYPHAYAGITYFNSGSHEEAINAFKRAEAVEPENLYVQKMLATIYGSLGEYDNAMEHAKKMLRLDNGNTEALFLTGVSYYKKGLIKEAAAEFSKAACSNRDGIYSERSKKALKKLGASPDCLP